MAPQSQQVYDVPTRVFHWFFSALFVTAFVIAKTSDDESGVFPFHMLAGICLGTLVVLRGVWGLVGTRHARFSDFALSPRALLAYFRGLFRGDLTRWAGHNPASSFAAVLMLILGLLLACSGIGMTSQAIQSESVKEVVEELHELLANVFVLTAGMHVIGIAVHTVRHREAIGLSMITGKKRDIPPEQAIVSTRPWAGVLLAALMVSLALGLYRNYTTNAGTLKILGFTLQLTEPE